jgi:hypothetical protein
MGNSIHPLGKTYLLYINSIEVAFCDQILLVEKGKDGALMKKHPQVCVKLSYKGYTNSRWKELANGYSTTAQLRQQYMMTSTQHMSKWFC